MPNRRFLALIAALTLLLLATGIVFAQAPATPADGDGLPDAWEIQFNLNPNNANGIDGAMGDPDRDGLPNGDEWANGTNPRNADTDGDGLPDLWEVENLTDPLRGDGDFGANGDPDGDGLLNKDELARGVDAQNWDTDGDGLPDGWEVVEGLKPNDNRGQNGANGVGAINRSQNGTNGVGANSSGETNRARFERLNDDYSLPAPHGRHP